ncbi:hypothetical protein Tco_1555441 [Tanacetum coccineum]
MGGSYYSFPCSILSTGKDCKTPNIKESWALLEDLVLYDNESWNDPRDFAKPVKAISLPQDIPSTSDRRLIELENQVQRLMEAHLAPKKHVQVNKISSLCEIYSGPHDTQYCMENPEQAFVKYASSRTDEAGGLVSNIMASQDARLSKFEADFKQQHGEMTKKIDTVLKAIIDRITGALPSDMFRRGFIDTAMAVVVIRKDKLAVGEESLRESYKTRPSSDGVGAQTPYYARKEFMDCHLLDEWEIARDVEINPFKDVLDKPPKNKDGAWHAKIRLIDPDGEEFTKTLQSVPTSRILSERESPREIIDLDYFYDT